MKHEWLTLEAYFAKPGAERDLLRAGTRVVAVIDTGAEITVVPRDLVNLVYGGDVQSFASTSVATMSGITRLETVPLLVGLSTADKKPTHAQVDCVIGQLDRVLLGSDVLSLLGLELRIDFHEKLVQLERYTWERFEDEVAKVYRSLGASVKQNLNIGGFQGDIVAEEATQSGQKLRLLVECKFYRDKVGNRVVNDFARVVATLKASELIDRGVIVSYRGFTQDATLVAESTGLELLTLDDLRQRLPESMRQDRPTAHKRGKAAEQRRCTAVRRFFVAMPFAPDMDDVYHLGIRETVQALGGACERADEIQHTGGIIEKIHDSIRSASIMIAELSLPNPNVFYEIGFAHALGKPVVLITRDIAGSPFDLRGYNHIVYKSIVELRRSLESMLRELLK
jgi:hypothetical protein